MFEISKFCKKNNTNKKIYNLEKLIHYQLVAKRSMDNFLLFFHLQLLYKKYMFHNLKKKL